VALNNIRLDIDDNHRSNLLPLGVGSGIGQSSGPAFHSARAYPFIGLKSEENAQISQFTVTIHPNSIE
jgi:hypothetical protein